MEDINSLQPQLNDTSMDKVLKQQSSSLSTLDNFWQSFHLFSLRFDEYVFDHIFVFIFLAYLIALVLDLLFDLRSKAFDPGRDFVYVKYDLTNWILISLAVALVLIVMSFNRWRSSIPSTFQKLLSKERINSTKQEANITQEYRYFLEEYQRTLLSSKRYFVIGISMLIAFGYAFIHERSFILSPHPSDPYLLLLGWLLAIFKPSGQKRRLKGSDRLKEKDRRFKQEESL